MIRFNDYSIKIKLIVIFIVFKILPLLLLTIISLDSFLDIKKLLLTSSEKIIEKTHKSIKEATDIAILSSIKALDKKSQDMLENKTLSIAKDVANFLKQRDRDILFLSKQDINQKTLENFFNQKNRKIHLATNYYYSEKEDKWKSENTTIVEKNIETADLKSNTLLFHKVNPSHTRKELIPIYKEITYYNVKGEEIYKVSSIDSRLKNIADKQNTYCKAEDYYHESLQLQEGDIYVSKVIGEYVPSPIIGLFNRPKAKKANIKFEPEKYGYAGAENPLGKKFEGIVRFVTPVYKNSKLQGYLSLALDHRHIMDFTDFVDPLSTAPLDIPDASKGNYAFMWSADFKAISHPRDYFIVGYNSQTGEMVPGWIDSSLAHAFKTSGETNLNDFLKKQTIFLNQSLDKKPNMEQVKIGQVGLDCRYLNFAPQCQGWSQLTDKGGYGSFVIYWSKVWKLTTAATIPYYTGQYKNSKRGFGFVTIGANIEEFHKTATQTKKDIETTLKKEEQQIKSSIALIIEKILTNIKNQINKLTIMTVLLIIVIVYVAIYISNNISNRIKSIIIATDKIKNKDFKYQIKVNEKDEIGQLKKSFNTMAKSINTLTNSLEKQLFTDKLTNLKNRNAFLKDLKHHNNPILALIDIDLFKHINDYYGIDAGNFILVEFAHILDDFAQKNSMIAYRIGSDEYLLLADKKDNNEDIIKIIEELKQIVEKKHFINKELKIDIIISFTCGIACGKGNLLENADLALNEAIRKKISYMKYNKNDPHMNKHKENILWREKIQYAIENDMIVPFFQEIIDVKNPENKKYEALIRIVDGKDIITPYLFLNIAKETKQYPEITKIMIEKTFKIFENCNANFSINLSVDDIINSDTVEFISKKLEQYNVKDRLIFELLESEEISNFSDIMPFVDSMKRLGVKFAIDDFGSGYSNFSYLLQIKPDFIKIDGSIIKNLTLDSNKYHIVNAIVIFAKSLNIKVIAEHVSSQNIITVLSDFDIDYMQGFYFSEPSPKLDSSSKL